MKKRLIVRTAAEGFVASLKMLPFIAKDYRAEVLQGCWGMRLNDIICSFDHLECRPTHIVYFKSIKTSNVMLIKLMGTKLECLENARVFSVL